jgi:nucleoid-associated protein YgaU
VKRAACVAALLLAATGASAEGTLHVVQPGETLSIIAQERWGDSSLWTVLYKANRDQIKDPARIYPGQELSIPPPGGAPRAALPPPGDDEDDE